MNYMGYSFIAHRLRHDRGWSSATALHSLSSASTRHFASNNGRAGSEKKAEDGVSGYKINPAQGLE